uniref:Uncharacterized protein n=1 Tax=Zea mays TaxID=4577 RepID=C4J1B6_MAIZE|nr:unknown [Zea mays]
MWLAMCPGSLQFQQTVFEVHSAAKWPGRLQLLHVGADGHSLAKCPGLRQFLHTRSLYPRRSLRRYGLRLLLRLRLWRGARSLRNLSLR